MEQLVEDLTDCDHAGMTNVMRSHKEWVKLMLHRSVPDFPITTNFPIFLLWGGSTLAVSQAVQENLHSTQSSQTFSTSASLARQTIRVQWPRFPLPYIITRILISQRSIFCDITVLTHETRRGDHLVSALCQFRWRSLYQIMFQCMLVSTCVVWCVNFNMWKVCMW